MEKAAEALKRVSEAVTAAAEKHPRVTVAVAAAVAVKAALSVRRRWRAVPLRGAVVVISGASQGIGEAAAMAFAAAGASKVLLLARGKAKLDTAAEAINSKYPGVAVPVVVDCGDQEAVFKAASAIVAEHGVPTILLNNAGVGRWLSLCEMDVKEVELCLAAPLMCSVWLTKAFLPAMLKSGQKSAVVFTQSPASLTAIPGSTMYTTARFALRGFVAALVSDLWSTNVKVQEVMLGDTASTYWENNPGSHERKPMIGKLIPQISTKSAGDAIVSSVRSGRTQTMYPFMLKLLGTSQPFTFGGLDWLLRATGWRFSGDDVARLK